MRNEQGHPHAESMKLYAEDARATDKPWELWQFRNRAVPTWEDHKDNPAWIVDTEYRRKPIEPELIQGYTAEQWQLIIDGGFDCEFSNNERTWSVGLLHRMNSSAGTYKFQKRDVDGIEFVSLCRPRRTKGVKQPWFGGICPVDSSARVVVYFNNGCIQESPADFWAWGHEQSHKIIAFIEL